MCFPDFFGLMLVDVFVWIQRWQIFRSLRLQLPQASVPSEFQSGCECCAKQLPPRTESHHTSAAPESGSSASSYIIHLSLRNHLLTESTFLNKNLRRGDESQALPSLRVFVVPFRGLFWRLNIWQRRWPGLKTGPS